MQILMITSNAVKCFSGNNLYVFYRQLLENKSEKVGDMIGAHTINLEVTEVLRNSDAHQQLVAELIGGYKREDSTINATT